MYLSQLINKTVYYQDKPFGKIVDMAVFENRPQPPISKIELLHADKKLTISPLAITFSHNKLLLKSQNIPLLPYDNKDFYLVEDLLDKQVIDVDGKRLVRVNDVLLEDGDELKVVGIDVGLDGILRRLGLGMISLQKKILPWMLIEAFDYQTGSIRLKLKEKSVAALHPSEIADILEEAGIKERVGILTALDPKKAARAIEETSGETQVSLLEQVPSTHFKDIVGKMHLSSIAHVFHYLNPLKTKEIQRILGTEKSQSLKRLSSFSDDVAGGLMHVTFPKVDGNVTVKEVIKMLPQQTSVPEVVVVTNGNEKFVGTIYVRNLFKADALAIVKDIITEKKAVSAQTSFEDIFRLFAEYNLRLLPVIEKETRKPIGVILIDDILKIVQEENEENENI